MNLLSDYGFKRIFGSKERKHLLIRFLNIIFAQDNLIVKDVEYHDKEVLPDDGSGKRIVYDVYCTMNGEDGHVIIEMQRAYHYFFEHRTVYYAAKAIASQGVKGWKYELKPVYSIFLLDFMFGHMARRQFRDVRLIDMESHEQYTDVLRMIFLHLSEVKRDWDECETDCDKILFIIKNMYHMDKESKAYLSGEFYDYFKESEVDNLAKEDFVEYRKSNMRYWEDQAIVDYATRKSLDEGLEEGRVQGLEKGLEKGKAQERRSIAKNMKEMGIDINIISQATGLSVEDIECL